MTSHTGNERFDWRRFVISGMAGGALAVGLLAGVGVPAAFAQPATTETEAPTADGPPDPTCTGEDCLTNDDDAPEVVAAPKMSADEALSIIYNEYAQGDGGGQISKLIDDAMKLRAQGFRPSNANAVALADALEYRPNQGPLVEALKETIAYQRKLQAQAQMSVNSGGPVPVIPSPSGGINIPLG